MSSVPDKPFVSGAQLIDADALVDATLHALQTLQEANADKFSEVKVSN